MYIDLAGPVFSSQTYHYIGPGFVTPLHVLAYFMTVLPFFILLQPNKIEIWQREADRSPGQPGVVTLSDVSFIISMLFLGDLFLDLFRNGSIPLFAHVERFVFTDKYAGAAHRWLVQYGNLLTFWWEPSCSPPNACANHRMDVRYLALLGLLVKPTCFLTGNRFLGHLQFRQLLHQRRFPAVIAADFRGGSPPAPFFWIGRFIQDARRNSSFSARPSSCWRSSA